jgi:hypothetical protein
MLITPSWTDLVTVLAPYAVIKGESYRVLTGLDLRTKFGAMLKIALACGGPTALTAGGGLYAKLYRVLNNDGVNHMNAALYFSGVQNAVGSALINNAANYAAGVSSIAYDGAGGTAFAAENQICLTGVVTVPTASGLITPSANGGTEWLNLSKGAATPALFNVPTKYLHLNNEFITLGSAWDIWLQGGSAYALVFDQLFDAAGEAMICAAYLQSYDSNSGT